MNGFNQELTEEQCEQYFQTIKAVLREHRHVTKYQVSNSTGVPMEAIRRLIREGRLEEKIDGSLEANENVDRAIETPEERRKRFIENLKDQAEARNVGKKPQVAQKEEKPSDEKKGIRFHTHTMDDK